MENHPFGASGVPVPLIGQGTWKLRDPVQAERALRRGLELGLTHIDTAELYEGSEEIVGRAIRGRRDDVFLVSKVLPQHGSRAGVERACEQSLQRLGVECLDVYLLHWPSDAHPLAETVAALDALVDAGKTRFIGVSNFDVDEVLEEAVGLARHPIVCNQVLYHLGDRGIEHALAPWCAANDVAVVAYSPFGSGGGFPPPEGDRSVLDDVARQHGATPHQVALAFLARLPGTFVIPKAETQAHVEENARALDLALDDDQVRRLDRAFPRAAAGPLGML